LPLSQICDPPPFAALFTTISYWASVSPLVGSEKLPEKVGVSVVTVPVGARLLGALGG
jgi:hypothetical protein